MSNIPKPLLIGRALSKSKGKRMPTPIINTGGETLKLQVNTVIREASEVDEDGILITNISEPKPGPKRHLGKTLYQSKTTLNDDEMSQLRNLVNEVSGDDEPTEKDRQMHLPQSKDFYLGPILLYKHKQKFPADMSKRNSRIVAKESESFRLTKGVLY
ncbi:hypothetical protein EB796_009858 [Bugula neritina]|uniref:Uncharacterized protein n=1 Tax=Bugula neritina TaxID=10212 RepID=A0A7J7K0Y6_BUGNE|nr:hypothetical protein EB796_009858 [Bugula neritina]